MLILWCRMYNHEPAELYGELVGEWAWIFGDWLDGADRFGRRQIVLRMRTRMLGVV